MPDQMELSINAGGRSALHTSLKEGLPSGQTKPVWWALVEGLVGEGLFLSLPGEFQAEGPSSELGLCGRLNDHLVKPSAWHCSLSHMTGSWSDWMFIMSVSLTCSFYPSWGTFWLVRNLPTMKLSAPLPRALRRHWEVIPSLISGVTRSWEPAEQFIWCCHLLTTFPPSTLWVELLRLFCHFCSKEGLLFPCLGDRHWAVIAPGLLFMNS